MAESSSMLPLGTSLPQFSLTDVVSGQIISSTDFSGKPLLVMFICRHCPYVKHVENELAKLGKDYQGKIGIVAISSNDITAYPEDAPESLKEQAEEVGFSFPYLYDESQDVAKSFRAACTPDLFLFDKEGKLVYRGQLDGSRPDSGIPVTGKDVRAAIDTLLFGQPISPDQKPSIGCGIKWKSVIT
ncbi:thioredoxin family protein [Candidatus Daviesbacteria bacterium]|nr:thioredoxin family protein [Candidatus Daviesbacteria bacterium]